jgi:hypothetical protein
MFGDVTLGTKRVDLDRAFLALQATFYLHHNSLDCDIDVDKECHHKTKYDVNANLFPFKVGSPILGNFCVSIVRR